MATDSLAKKIKLDVAGKDDGRINQGEGQEKTKEDIDVIRILPIEILTHVFTYLQRNDIVKAASVCTQWRKIIFNSPELWRKSQLTLRCSRQSSRSRNAASFCKRFGRYIRHLDIKCSHPRNHRCLFMAKSLQRLLRNLRTKGLNTFQVSELRVSARKPETIQSVGETLSRMLRSQRKLTVFHMSKGHWPPEVGNSIFNALTSKFSKSLRSLRVDDFFSPFYTPASSDAFGDGLSSLSRLSHLTINYNYLTDRSVLDLARGRTERLYRLVLLASDITPHSPFISTTAWKALAESCPRLKIDFRVRGHVRSPSVTIPAILDPVMRIHRLKLDIGSAFSVANGRHLHLSSILRFITSHFRKRLIKFSLNIDNHRDSMDKSLIRLVRKSRSLVAVKILGHFSHFERTRETIKDIIRNRRKKTPEVKAGHEASEKPTSSSDVVASDTGGHLSSDGLGNNDGGGGGGDQFSGANIRSRRRSSRAFGGQ